jgi:hypothetical protein
MHALVPTTDELRIWDVSQRIDRVKLRYPVGMCPVVCPGSRLWITSRRRLVTGLEAMWLQGGSMELFPQISQSASALLHDLAGNMFSTPVFAAVLVAAFAQ